jgi:hypothetical protein
MLKPPDPTLVFKQFGFKEQSEDVKNYNGECPFCHAAGHFGIAKDDPNKKWNCFKCGKQGGFQGFLREVVSFSKGNGLKELSKRRGLSVDLLESLQIGSINDRWVIPIFSHDGSTILNIKIYDGDSFKNTAGCSSSIYGLWTLPEKYNTVYFCEGEWDTMAMMEMVTATDIAVLGVPGAGATLKNDIIDLFVGKSVYLFYDNDPAGRAGTAKTISALTPVAAEIKYLAWPEDTAPGYDVRDIFTKKENPLEWLEKHLKATEVLNAGETDITGGYVPYTDVYDAFGKWFHLSDNRKYDQKATDIYDVCFGAVFANRIPGDPVWLYVCAPPGGFKTVPLLAMTGGKHIEIHESVTAPALISGQNQGAVDPSLIPKLNGKVLIVKDWTIILGLPEHERKEIESILRGAFDGVCGRTFGNGIRRDIKSTFGIIAATTPVIEQYFEETSATGERFLTWRNWISKDFTVRHEHIKKAIENISQEIKINKEINGIAKRVLLYKHENLPTYTKEQMERFIHIGQFIAAMRGAVTRDRYRKNVLYTPFSEVATRLTKQLVKLAMGISIFKNQERVANDTFRILKTVAWSSVSSRYAEALKAFMRKDIMTPVDVEKQINLPVETVAIVMENMSMLGIIERIEKLKWHVKPRFKTLVEQADLI